MTGERTWRDEERDRRDAIKKNVEKLLEEGNPSHMPLWQCVLCVAAYGAVLVVMTYIILEVVAG